MMSAYIVIANKIYIPLERNDNHKAFWDQGFAISFILLEMVTASSKPLLMLCKMSGSVGLMKHFGARWKSLRGIRVNALV